ncbi:thiamine ABC transporter substrate-binding protein [Halomarina oriensis]|uniref:Thiamine ABC transporter substrate-binding protein n=1 Tax=Halomarina oriensis TaxID=671145 RepID=A0A6B0GLU1_9EURY|nr:thiamine ABC transporter substrate-binding protein [Halomarina oriensis]MWG34861.1 thiamine ABC transporter substrate-binding protein [Halomarina oriensis]
MKRRSFLLTAGAGTAALAGCLGDDGGETNGTGDTTDGDGETRTETTAGTTTGSSDGGDETLVVATYPTWVEGDSPAGAWVKERFEAEHGATVEYTTPDSRFNYYLGRAAQGAPIDADLFLGLNVDDLIRLDDEVDDEVFTPLSVDAPIKETLQFDPQGRAIPYDTGLISLVYDETAVEAPATFDDLLADEYRGDLLAQNAQSSATGRAFMLHTVKEKGPDGYLDYWRGLQDNEVRILGNWSDSYTAYENGEAPMVVSYSTDQVYAHRNDADLSRHQVGFLNGEGYANPEGVARFAASEQQELAATFVEFLLTPEAQGQIAQRNVQYPATTNADLPEEFQQYTFEPETAVTFTYEELKGNVDEWVDQWAREIAQG